jgi:transmembrane sensor
MLPKSHTRLSAHARNEAAEWFVSMRERDGDESTRRGFHAWLRKSPENVHAFLRMTALWEDSGLLKSSSFDPKAMLERATHSANVLELETISTVPTATPPSPARRRLGISIAAGVLLVITGITWLQVRKDTYVTETGEQRTVALPDGTSIELNATSRLRIRFSKNERNVDLLEGQAIFRVAHNATRPFIVHSGATHVRAVGTQFDVYRRADGTTVTVLEGAVAVRTNGTSAQVHGEDTISKDQKGLARLGGSSGDVLVAAGEQIDASAATIGAPHPVDVTVATAWSQGKLIFHETPLNEVVAEFNRYSSRRLVIEDPQLRQFHVSGVFPSSDPSRVAELLHQRFGATVRQSDDEIRVSR